MIIKKIINNTKEILSSAKVFLKNFFIKSNYSLRNILNEEIYLNTINKIVKIKKLPSVCDK